MSDLSFIYKSVLGKTILIVLIVLLALVLISAGSKNIFLHPDDMVSSGSKHQELEWKKEVLIMIKEQIIARGIKDKRVIEAMTNPPRHKFVPLKYRESAYDDGPLPIGEG